MRPEWSKDQILDTWPRLAETVRKCGIKIIGGNIIVRPKKTVLLLFTESGFSQTFQDELQSHKEPCNANRHCDGWGAYAYAETATTKDRTIECGVWQLYPACIP